MEGFRIEAFFKPMPPKRSLTAAPDLARPWRRKKGPGVDDEVIEILDDKEKEEDEEEEDEPLVGTNNEGWHYCAQRGCGYKAKQKGHLKQHEASVHDVGVEWHYCEHPGCDYRAKQKSNLKRHCASNHGTGKK